MSELTVAATQLAALSEDFSANVQRMEHLMREASSKGVQIICFPELSLTPFFPVVNSRHYDHYFMDVENEYILMIREAARKYRIHTIIGFAEKDYPYFYNSSLLINNDGDIQGTYRKRYIPGAFIGEKVTNFEKLYFSPGNLGCPVFDLGFVKVGMQICYDRHFPEGYRKLALDGADIVFNLTAGGSYKTSWRTETWDLILRARAFENGLFVVGVNKVGVENGVEFFGKSSIISPLNGEILAQSTINKGDELLVRTINLEDIVEARKRLPFPRDLMMVP